MNIEHRTPNIELRMKKRKETTYITEILINILQIQEYYLRIWVRISKWLNINIISNK